MSVRRLRVRIVVAFLASGGPALPGVGHGGDRFVAVRGVDAGDCSVAIAPCASIAHALGQAMNGDTVKIAKGKYRENLVVGHPTALTMTGGWANDFVERDVVSNRTIIDGSRLSSVLSIQAGAGEATDVALDGVTITKGVAGAGGGGGIAIAADSDAVLTVSLTNVVVTKNGGSGTDGAGVSVDAAGTSSITLPWSDVNLTNNRQTNFGNGGALALRARGASSVSFSCSRCDLSKNKADFVGAGVYARSVDTSSIALTFQASTLALNQQTGSSGAGGAFWVRALNGSTITLSLSESAVVRNRSKFGGGAGIAAGADGGAVDLFLVNTIVSGNKGAVGVGVNIGANGGTMTAELRNSTVSGNKDVVRGSPGILVASGDGVSSTTLQLVNAIVWGNSPAGIDLRTTNGGFGNAVTVTSDHSDIGCLSCSADVTDLGGSFDADPLLISAKKDPRLKPGSPCIDTGTCIGAPATDRDGDVRPAGAGCDVGADEFVL